MHCAPFCRIILLAVPLAAASCASLKSRVALRGPQSVAASLQAAHESWQAMPAGRRENDEQRTEWRASLGGLLQSLQQHRAPRTWTGTQSIAGWSVTFAGDASGLNSIPPSWCERIAPVEPLLPLAGIKGARVSSEGAGLPVVMVQPRKQGAPEKFVPLNGRHYPATFTAEFSGPRKVTLTFHHTRNVSTARLRGDVRPLAYDLSEAIATAMHSKFYAKYSLRGLFRPQADLDATSIYAPEPFDPRKIPVVLVHGIESAPHIWANVMNEMAADPELRRRCQVWYFLYPTGISIQGAAARLRTALTEARDFYDPRHTSAALRRTVLVGHSMGGLLSKMQIMDSGEDLHRAFWTEPLEKLPLSGETRAVVGRTLHFQHVPFVRRAVFITTPHGGSSFTDYSIVRVVLNLIQPAKIVAGLAREMASVARSVVNPELHRFKTFGIRSHEGLSPQHPMLHALKRRPLHAPFDSIIAVFPPMSGSKPLEQSTDGVVPWSSAWLPGADSTSTITGFHTCIPYPELAEKLMPVLRRHAGAN